LLHGQNERRGAKFGDAGIHLKISPLAPFTPGLPLPINNIGQSFRRGQDIGQIDACEASNLLCSVSCDFEVKSV
jgi:hypothetical protein